MVDDRRELAGSPSGHPAMAKKNLLILKGGLAESFLEIPLIMIAFLAS
jgi:hypothetical protein